MLCHLLFVRSSPLGESLRLVISTIIGNTNLLTVYFEFPSFLDAGLLQRRIRRPAHEKLPLVVDRRCPLQHADACPSFLKLIVTRDVVAQVCFSR